MPEPQQREPKWLCLLRDNRGCGGRGPGEGLRGQIFGFLILWDFLMAGTTSAALIAELDDVIKVGSPSRQTRILEQVTDLFQADVDRLDETQTDVFDDVLIRLMERVDKQALIHLSTILSEIELAPRETVRRLAFHEDTAVAAPILAKSNRLSEKHLIEIAGSCGQQHLLAISARKSLNESLTEALIRRGDTVVFNALAQNAGARFSESGYAALIGNAERDESLIERLGLRMDIPAKLLRKVLAMATDAVWLRLSRATRPVAHHKGHSPDAAASITPSSPIDYTEVMNEVVALNRAGKLKDPTVNRFAVRGEQEKVVAALAFMTEVKAEEIEPLMKDGRLYGLIVACKAARLDWSTTTQIIRNRPGCPPVTARELEQGREVFDALLLSVAQWSIRFGGDQIAARGGSGAERAKPRT
jgi:uncharacterized protein (DUF2336 family)